MLTFESNGAQIHYTEYAAQSNAKGRDTLPIVLTHGAAMDLHQWEPQIAALAEQHRVVAWDVRGHGESTLPPGAVDSALFSADLVALLDRLSIARALLVGLSMGGHIALQTAVRFPERVAGLVLIGAPFTNAFNWFERLMVPLNRASVRGLPYAWTIAMTAAATSQANSDNRAYVESAYGKIPKERFLRLWDAVLRMESGDDLSRVHCPTLVLQGDRDKFISRQQQALTAGIAGARHQWIENAGHLTNRDNPAAVNAAILAFAEEIEQRNASGQST